jgi:hypothetical protein
VSTVAAGFSSLASGQNPAHAFVRSSSAAVLFFPFQAIFFSRTDLDFAVRFPHSKFLFCLRLMLKSVSGTSAL